MSGSEEQRKVVAHRYNTIRVFVDSGICGGEMASIRTADLDLDEYGITVTGKGNRIRFVPFGVKAGEDLDQYIRERNRHAQSNAKALWVGTKGRLSESGITQILRRYGASVKGERARDAHRKHSPGDRL